MAHDDGDPQPTGPAADIPATELCRSGWAVPGGTGHVCYLNRGHAGPHRCSYCGLKNDLEDVPASQQDHGPGIDPIPE